MKILAVTAGMVALLGSTVFLPAASNAAGIAGYLDPSTGSFTAVQNVVPAASLLTRTGTITLVLSVTIQSSIPAGLPITCSASISSSDFPGINNSASAESSVIRSGNSGKCTIVIPYNWLVASVKTMMSVNSINVTASNETQGGGAYRSASTSFPAFPVPNGAKTITVQLAL